MMSLIPEVPLKNIKRELSCIFFREISVQSVKPIPKPVIYEVNSEPVSLGDGCGNQKQTKG